MRNKMCHVPHVHRMSLSRIQSLGIAAVLEDCSNQLDIVGHIVRVQISRERGAAAAQVNFALLFDLICLYKISGHM